jgi:hypothetical protein
MSKQKYAFFLSYPLGRRKRRPVELKKFKLLKTISSLLLEVSKIKTRVKSKFCFLNFMNITCVEVFMS